MKKFVVTLKDKNPEAFNESIVVNHVNHLKKLSENGVLFLCGPLKGFDGAMQILIAETIEDATELAKADPFLKEGSYQNFSIYELIEANEENNFLLK